jgi:hypothetical protein
MKILFKEMGGLTLGKVGKLGWFSRPRATELMTVPRPQGIAK